MKNILTLLLLVIVYSAAAQPFVRKNPVKMILFEPEKNPKLYVLQEGQKTSIKTSTAIYSDVYIMTISQDTIFIAEHKIPLDEIEMAEVQLFSRGRGVPFNTAVYSKNEKWDIFIPPDDTYNDLRSQNRYVITVEEEVKKDRMDMLIPPFMPNMFKVNITKIFYGELDFSLEHRFDQKWSLETECGVKIPYNAPAHESNSDFFTNPLFLMEYNGFSLSLGPKYYFNPRGYIQFYFQYRYLEHKGFHEDNEDDIKYDDFINEYTTAWRVGKLFYLGRNAVMEGYLGFGFRYTDHYKGEYKSLNNSGYEGYTYIDKYGKLLPTINVGIRIGKLF